MTPAVAQHLIELIAVLACGIVPPDPEQAATCLKAAVCLVSFLINKLDVVVQLHDNASDTDVVLADMHPSWYNRALRQINADPQAQKSIQQLGSSFRIHLTVPISSSIDFVAHLASKLHHTCNLCQSIFFYEINKNRCVASHVDGKRRKGSRKEDRTWHDRANLEQTWDALPAAERFDVSAPALTILQFLFSMEVIDSFPLMERRVLTAIYTSAKNGTPAELLKLQGKELMGTLDGISEGSCFLHLVGKPPPSTSRSRGDFAAMAGAIVIDQLLQLRADKAMAALQQDEADELAAHKAAQLRKAAQTQRRREAKASAAAAKLEAAEAKAAAAAAAVAAAEAKAAAVAAVAAAEAEAAALAAAEAAEAEAAAEAAEAAAVAEAERATMAESVAEAISLIRAVAQGMEKKFSPHQVDRAVDIIFNLKMVETCAWGDCC